jgi:hypothetical protein
MALFNGQVAIATKSSLYLMGGQPYPGEADDPTVTADTSKAAEWRGEPEPIMTHGQFASGDDFTFLASYRGRLYTWLQGRVAEFDGSNELWLRMGPEGVRCFGGSVAGDWLCVAIESRYGGFELWGFNGEGWWRLLERASPAILWPTALAGAGNRELIVFRDASATYDLTRLNWRSSSVHTYSALGQWYSSLLDAGAPGSVKAWTEFGATFAMPENRGNAASVDSLTISLDYSIDGGATFIAADSETTTAAAARTFTLRSALPAAVDVRYLQLRVTWSSVSDWAPVLSSAWAEYELPEIVTLRRRVWSFDVDASDRTVRRDGGKDPQDGRTKARALWELWEGGNELVFTETDGGLWDPGELGGRALWLAGDRLSGVANGAALAAWADATGNGLTAVQLVAANQPKLFDAQLNGLAVVRFDGGDWLTIDSAELEISAQPYSVYAVWKPSGPGQALMFAANSTGLITTDFDDDVGIFAGSALFDFDHHPFGQWHIIGSVFDGVSSRIKVDGLSGTTGSAGAGVLGGDLTIGAGVNGGDRWLNGDLAELVITRTALSSDDRERLDGYLAHKWGLAANLPINHPYKNAAPLTGPLVRIDSIEEKVARPGDAHRWGEAEIALVLEEV